MDLNLGQAIADLMVMAIGSLGTWAIWVSRELIKRKRDLDHAFTKIRQMEKGNGHTRKNRRSVSRKARH